MQRYMTFIKQWCYVNSISCLISICRRCREKMTVFCDKRFSLDKDTERKRVLKGRQMTYEWVGSEAQTELIRQEENQDGTMTWHEDKGRKRETWEERRGDPDETEDILWPTYSPFSNQTKICVFLKVHLVEVLTSILVHTLCLEEGIALTTIRYSPSTTISI